MGSFELAAAATIPRSCANAVGIRFGFHRNELLTTLQKTGVIAGAEASVAAVGLPTGEQIRKALAAAAFDPHDPALILAETSS